MSQRLDRGRPLWTLDVVDRVGSDRMALALKRSERELSSRARFTSFARPVGTRRAKGRRAAPRAARHGGKRNSTVVIRRERRDDYEAVAALHLAAFRDHGVRVVGLLDDLRAQRDAISLVAERDGAVAGHVLFSRGWIDALRRLVEVAILSPVAVLPPQQRRGVASALIQHGLQLLDELGVAAAFVEGPPQYYGRLGFAPTVGAGFRKPSLRIPDDAFQVARLGRYEPWMTGTVVYGDVFWRHDAVGLRD